MAAIELARFANYLRETGWALDDDDGRTTLWRPQRPGSDNDIRIVLPAREEVRDYQARMGEALRALAFVERRTQREVANDIRFGGADSVAIRLTPAAPPGEAPLRIFYSAVAALRNYVTASAAALEIRSFVLPPRAPGRAELYAGQARVFTQPGSFVLGLALPLADAYDEPWQPADQESLVSVVPQPFGRRVTNRMLVAARRALRLADAVNSGEQPLQGFARLDRDSANATELASLAAFGGPDHEPYQIRFAMSPLAPGVYEPETVRIRVAPGQQRILGEAADFLRTRQPRADVPVIGLVVRLFRATSLGPGEIVVQGLSDDSGEAHRFRVELSERDYNDAVRAHRDGLQVAIRGDLVVRGTRLSLRPVTSFAVLPSLDDE
jgi:hypothetical protein